MESVRKMIGMVLLSLAVGAYCVYNYMTGRTDASTLVFSLLILCLPVVNMISILLRNRNNEK